MTSAGSGGVPPLLSSSTHALLTAGAGVAGLSLPGRPIHSMLPVVPSFVSTFANPLMSTFSSASAYSLPSSATRDVADCPAVPASPVVDQPFVVGPGFSPVPATLVAQIVASKYMVHTDLRPFFSRTFQGLFKDKSFSFKDLIFYSIRHTCNKPIDINDFLYGMLCKETCNINRKLP